MAYNSQLGNIVKDPQGNDLLFDVTSPCISGVGEHYTAERTGYGGYSSIPPSLDEINDVPLYYEVTEQVALGTEWKLYCWKFCPYSQEWRIHHRTTEAETGVEMAVDGYYTATTISGERFQYQVTSDKQTWHGNTRGRMAYHQRGRIAGFICVDPDCYYYTTTSGYFFQV